MTVTATLVDATPNRLRYLVEDDGDDDGGSAEITTADLLADTLAGPLKRLARVVADGFAVFAAGAQTQAKARALWLSDWAGANPSPGTPANVVSLVTTAICRLAPCDSESAWSVDADVTAGSPKIVVTSNPSGVGCTEIAVSWETVSDSGSVHAASIEVVYAGCQLSITQINGWNGSVFFGPDVDDFVTALAAVGWTYVPGAADGFTLAVTNGNYTLSGVECDDGDLAFIWEDMSSGGPEYLGDDIFLPLPDGPEAECSTPSASMCYLDVFVPEAIG